MSLVITTSGMPVTWVCLELSVYSVDLSVMGSHESQVDNEEREAEVRTTRI